MVVLRRATLWFRVRMVRLSRAFDSDRGIQLVLWILVVLFYTWSPDHGRRSITAKELICSSQ